MRARLVNPLVVRAESKVKSKVGFRANEASFVDHESKLAPLQPSPALANPRQPSPASRALTFLPCATCTCTRWSRSLFKVPCFETRTAMERCQSGSGQWTLVCGGAS